MVLSHGHVQNRFHRTLTNSEHEKTAKPVSVVKWVDGFKENKLSSIDVQLVLDCA